MKRGRVVAGALVAYAICACSLVTSLDGLSTAPAPDGGDAAGIDAPTETSPPSDAEPEADAGDGGGPFCSQQTPKPTFCADFDTSDTLPLPFDRQVRNGNGKIEIDGVRSASAPRSLLSSLGPNVPSAAALGVSFPSASVLTIDFDVAVESTGTVGFDFLTLDAPGGFELGLELNGNVVSFENERLEDGGLGSKVPTGGRVESAFTHVTFSVRRAGNGATVDVVIGQTQFSTPAPPSILTTPELLIGDDAHQMQETGTWKVRFDNVVVRTTPK